MPSAFGEQRSFARAGGCLNEEDGAAIFLVRLSYLVGELLQSIFPSVKVFGCATVRYERALRRDIDS